MYIFEKPIFTNRAFVKIGFSKDLFADKRKWLAINFSTDNLVLILVTNCKYSNSLFLINISSTFQLEGLESILINFI